MFKQKVAFVAALAFCCALGVGCSMNLGDEGGVASSPSAGSSEDFAHEYELKEGGSVRVKNVSGDVTVRGTDTNRVSVRGIKEGRDRDKIEVVDKSGGDSVDIGVRYNCRNCNASIRFEVEVPRGMRLDFKEIGTASGDVRIENVTGNVEAESASGDISARDITGRVSAETASGNIDVRINQVAGDGDMKCSTASGNVEVAVPGNINAEVELSTVSGNVKTDFPIEVERPQYGPGESAEGRLGDGGRKLKLSTVSGNVKLSRS